MRGLKLGALTVDEAVVQMAQCGLALRIPPITLRIRTSLGHFAEQVFDLYRDYELADVADYADIDIRMLRVTGLRNRTHQMVQFIVDGTTPFDSFPLGQALPMFEWGLNWVFAHRMHTYLLLHAAVVERRGQALVLPAWPGSGKTTLAASLMCRGWRFLSDEFGAVAGRGVQVVPFVRPAALKNASIDVMRAFAPDAIIGPVIPGTRKGDVAYLRIPADSVAQGSVPAHIAAIVFPEFHADNSTLLQPLSKATAFLKLAGNSFNYEVVGEAGFRAVTSMVRRCTCHTLRYGDLESAHVALDEVVANAAHK